MSQPPPYNPSSSFITYSAGLPGFPGQQLDAEFSNIKTTTNAISSNLALIQRDDGELANESVDVPQLGPDLKALLGIGSVTIIGGSIVIAFARHQRSVTATPISISANDQILNCNINVPAACTLPLAGTRAGLPLTFKDLGQASANPITITATNPDTIDGHTTYVIHNNRQAVTLVPFNDGVNNGWNIE